MTTPAPLPPKDLKITLREFERRLREVERALRKSAGTLKMRVEQLVNARIAGAVNHQVFTYMDGDWVPRGGNVFERTYSASGTGTVTILEDLVTPADWPADQVWVASAKVKLAVAMGEEYETGTTSAFLGIASTPITLDDPADPSTVLSFTGAGFTADFPVDLLRQPSDLPTLTIGLLDAGTPMAGSVVDARTIFFTSTATLYPPGATPQVLAELISDAAVYPSGVDMDVTVLLYPLA